MQILARAGEDFPFFSRLGPPRATPESPSPPLEEAEQTLTPGLAPLEFVSKATSALRSASSRARRALVELKDDIIDFGGSQQQALSQGPGWALPWAAKTEVERQREEIRRRLRELSKEPFRFLVPPLDSPDMSPEEVTGSLLEEGITAAAAETALEDDPCLKALQDEIVPRMLSETEFWHRYFTAVRAIEVEVFHTSEIAACLNVTESATSSSGEFMASLWLGGRRTGGVSPVRPFNVDGDEAEGNDGLLDARRSVSEQGEALCQRKEPAALHCCMEGATKCRSENCASCQSVQGAGRSLVQSFGSFIEFGDPAGDGIGASLPRQLSSVSVEQPAPPSLGVVSEVREAAESGGPVMWIRRTVNGIGAMSGLAPGDSSEAQHKETLEEQPQGPAPSGAHSGPSTVEGHACVNREQELAMGQGEGEGEPAFLSARDSLPCSTALEHLSSACASATAFGSCLDLLAAGCDSSPSYPWPAFAPLSAVGDALRHSISGQHGQSPTRSGAPTASSCSSPGDETLMASKGLRLPYQKAIITALFSQRPPRESQAGLSSGAASPVQGSSTPGLKAVGRSRAGLTRTLHGAPAGSFVADLALAMASLSSVQEMAQMWLDIVEELRECFRSGKLIPGVPLESEHPDLQMCEVMQHLQLLNLCMQRRERRALRLAADTAGEGRENSLELVCLPGRCAERPPLATLHVQVSNKLAHPTGEPEPSCTSLCSSGSDTTGAGSPLIVSRRRGVKEVVPGLMLLETGEALAIPETQDTPLMTETSVRESEELIINTGTLGSGCKQLFSDMQAFKAANPGCLLEDFVRWYSPPDWSPLPYNPPLSRPASAEEEPGTREDELVLVGMEEVRQAVGGSGSGSQARHSRAEACTGAAPASLGAAAAGSRRGLSALGFLSPRMVFAGNLWQELWDRAEPISAMDQPPLYDAEEGGQNSLAWLQDLAPAELLEQLFVTLVAIGLASAHDLPEASQEPLRTSLGECVRYATATCCRGMGPRKQRWVCTVYRVMEMARAAASPGALPGGSLGVHLNSSLCPTSAPQRGRGPAEIGAVSASSSLRHDRCGPRREGQEPPHLSLQQESTEGHTGKGLVGIAAEEAPAGATPALPLDGDAQPSSQVGSSEARPSLDGSDRALPTPPQDPLALSAAAAPDEERREDPSTGIRQAAAAIFSKLRAGPGWSRPSVSWSNLEGAAAPFRAAEPVPPPGLAPLEGASGGEGEAQRSSCTALGPESAPQRSFSETLRPATEDSMGGVSPAGEGKCMGQVIEPRVQDTPVVASEVTMSQLAAKAMASCVPSGLRPKEKEVEGEWVII